jgi:hypothetical protein
MRQNKAPLAFTQTHIFYFHQTNAEREAYFLYFSVLGERYFACKIWHGHLRAQRTPTILTARINNLCVLIWLTAASARRPSKRIKILSNKTSPPGYYVLGLIILSCRPT